MEDKLNMSREQLMEDLKQRIEEKKLLKAAQESLLHAAECLTPVFTKLRELTITAEEVLVNTEIGNRFLDNRVKELSEDPLVGESDGMSAVLAEGKELFVQTQKTTKEEDEQIEFIMEEYKEVFEELRTVFEDEYGKVSGSKEAQAKFKSQLEERKAKSVEEESKFVEELKTTATALTSKDKSKFTFDNRDICDCR
eukprot:TRINITY_DN9130_c0_g2_i1.p3 TRINITY_DN9130_c0_g2~~TRINITY_DN9130_c0_g2_i1.p3  ORF type:complete len:196 (-),score=86.91 TRINITY_DN9130_c0_g2_i1:496-1083(-)